jgi:hypothetical protein
MAEPDFGIPKHEYELFVLLSFIYILAIATEMYQFVLTLEPSQLPSCAAALSCTTSEISPRSQSLVVELFMLVCLPDF